MNWDDLATFRCVAEELSFTRAADRLCVSTPAVSQRVRRLERSVGAQLLLRSTHRVELTPAGAGLLARIDEIAAVWEQARADLARCADPAVERRPATLGICRISHVELLDRVGAAVPDRRWGLRMVPELGPAVAAARRGDLDVLVWQRWPAEREPALGGLLVTDVVREPVWAYVAAGHPSARSAVVELATLRDEPWIDVATDEGGSLAAICQAAGGFTPRIAHVVHDVGTYVDLLGRGLGVAVGSPCASPTPGVARRPVAGAPVLPIRLAAHPTRLPRRAVEDVLRAVRERYLDQAAAVNPEYAERLHADPAALPRPAWRTRG